ncbi:MAG: hypothetical protein GH155_02460 [Spirochaeta sp.]|nr:hypothetical protein [Spirochaeta sp.]
MLVKYLHNPRPNTSNKLIIDPIGRKRISIIAMNQHVYTTANKDMLK